MDRVPHYQRAVTPTLDSGVSSPSIRGKVLSYNSNVLRGRTSMVGTNEKISSGIAGMGGNQVRVASGSPHARASFNTEINVQGRSTSNKLQSIGFVNPSSGSIKGTVDSSSGHLEQLSSLSVLPRYDLVPISDVVPQDGIIFARVRNNPDSLVVFRTPEERLRNPERLNLDRRQLEICPLLEQEQRLRLLNFQNNSIRAIQNLENLPNLIFLDLYNNKITSLEGPLSLVKGLRVLMAGKNKISVISNLQTLRKLDVLDLHSNEIRTIEGLDGLADLRVLNLAGNRISMVDNLSSLVSLTELNLRRNGIEHIQGLNQLPALQRIFLSHNLLSTMDDIKCLFEVSYLIELSLDGNPVSENDPVMYRNQVIDSIPGLRHLDLKRITDEERSKARSFVEMGGLYSEANALLNENRSGDADSASLPDTSSERYRSKKEVFRDEDSGIIGRASSDSDDISPERQIRSHSRSDGPGFIMQGNFVSNDSAVYKSSSNSEFADVEALSRDYPRAPNDGSSSLKNSMEATDSRVGLAAQARMGKISAIQRDMFDLEIIGNDEKALVAVGESWEWPSSRRMLQNVTEASICQMSSQAIQSKFTAAQLNGMPSLKTLRLFKNNFNSIKQIEFIPRLWGQFLEHLVVRDSPICSISEGQTMRAFLIASMPKLISFNEESIDESERKESCTQYGPLLRLMRASETLQATLTSKVSKMNGAKSNNIQQSRQRSLSGIRSFDDDDIGFDANGERDASGSASSKISELLHKTVMQRKKYDEFCKNFETVVKTLAVEAVEGTKPKRK